VTAAVATLLSPAAGASAPPRELTPAAAEAFFAARAAAPACEACAAPEPHAPAAHLAQPDACAAVAAACALLRRQPPGAWAAALDRLPAVAAAEACCLRLALAAPPPAEADEHDSDARASGDAAAGADSADGADGEESDEELLCDAPDADDTWLAPCAAVGAYAVRRMGLQPPDSAAAASGDGVPAWRAVPPWLAAVACGAHGALCDAYVAALLARPALRCAADDGGDVAAAYAAARVARADAAARLRCVLAAGGRGAARARRALAAWGCLWAEPPAKRRRTAAAE
jgi:hypothetical protein